MYNRSQTQKNEIMCLQENGRNQRILRQHELRMRNIACSVYTQILASNFNLYILMWEWLVLGARKLERVPREEAKETLRMSSREGRKLV